MCQSYFGFYLPVEIFSVVHSLPNNLKNQLLGEKASSDAPLINFEPIHSTILLTALILGIQLSNWYNLILKGNCLMVLGWFTENNIDSQDLSILQFAISIGLWHLQLSAATEVSDKPEPRPKDRDNQ